MLGLGEKMVARKNSRRMWPWPSPLLNVFLLGLGTERHVIVSMNAFSFEPGIPGKIYIHSSNQDKCMCDDQKGLIHHHPGGSGCFVRIKGGQWKSSRV